MHSGRWLQSTGALGYVNCALELLGQMVERGLTFDHMVTATGSAGTHAGLIVGLKALNAQLPLLGIGVRAPRDVQEGNVFRLAQATEAKLGVTGVVQREDVVANCDYIGKGYGIRQSRLWRRSRCSRVRKRSCWTRFIPARRRPG